MSARATARSSLVTSLLRYRRSWGLWLLLLAGPVGARYLVPADGATLTMSFDGRLPVMTTPVIGVSLGLIVSTLLLPIGFLYLRSNVTRRQPWQVEEVTPASRVAIACGRFAADAAVLAGALAALSVAGLFIAWLMLGAIDPFALLIPLCAIAAPSLMLVAALRIFCDARPMLRGGWGEALFFLVWIVALSAGAILGEARSDGSAVSIWDAFGYAQPLIGSAPPGVEGFSLGVSEVREGRVAIDPIAAIAAPGYLATRTAWVAIALLLVLLAGLAYRPHRARARRTRQWPLARLLSPGAPLAADAHAPAARRAGSALAALAGAEIRLILAGRLLPLLALAAGVAGAFVDYRRIASPAALLVLIFGLTAHAGWSEARGMRTLGRTTPFGPLARRLAFVAGGTLLSIATALPAVVAQSSPQPLLLAGATGAAAAGVAILLAALTGSGFAARLLLLIGWYAYLSV